MHWNEGRCQARRDRHLPDQGLSPTHRALAKISIQWYCSICVAHTKCCNFIGFDMLRREYIERLLYGCNYSRKSDMCFALTSLIVGLHVKRTFECLFKFSVLKLTATAYVHDLIEQQKLKFIQITSVYSLDNRSFSQRLGNCMSCSHSFCLNFLNLS